MPMSLILILNTIPFLISWSTTSYNAAIVTTYNYILKLLAILVSPPNLEVVTPNDIIANTLGSILLNSKYVINAYSRYYRDI